MELLGITRAPRVLGRAQLVVGLVAVAVTTAGCGGNDDVSNESAGASQGTVLVFAAASLADAFADLESAFEAANPMVDVRVNVGGSSALREQILAGAPADVFASASEAIMSQLLEAGEVSGDPRTFVRNRLEIVVPAGNPGGVSGLADFARRELLIGLCGEGVPCGDFARAALAKAGVEASIDTNELDVRALLTKVAVDELDAAIVYSTDVAAAGDSVEGIEISAEYNVVAAYPIAMLTGAPNPAAGAAFVEFVFSDEGQAILAGYQFAAP